MHTPMDNEPITDVTKICRVCLLSKHEADALRTMASTVKVLILQVLSIEVDSEHIWKICVPCLEFIKQAAQFRKMAKKSDQQIKVFLNSGEKPKETVYVHTPDMEESVDLLDSEIVVEDEMKYETDQERYSTELIPIQYDQIEEYQTTTTTSPPLPPTQQFLPVFKCDICPATFGRKRLLDRHRATRHTMQHDADHLMLLQPTKTNGTTTTTGKQQPNKKLTAKCVNGLWICCGRNFAHKRSLNQHQLRVHHGNRELPPAKRVYCMTCDQKFPNVSKLYQHIKHVHKGKRPTDCNVCGKEFRSVDSARKHKQKTHVELYQD